MPPLNVLIKPVSGACNMNCTYCFYADEAKNRKTACFGKMSDETLESLVSAAAEFAEGSCSFVFQGGEPTLAGLDFYKKVAELQEKYKKNGLRFYNSIQTNGYHIDEEWARFFHDNRYLVGLSLDGTAEIHNLNRVDFSGSGTFNRVMRAAKLFNKHGVEYNILSVITGKSARAAEKQYNFYKREGFDRLQFIPCLEPLGKEQGNEKYSLTPAAYGEFLIRLFDLWYADFAAGKYVSIRHIENLLGVFLGNEPEACNMKGCCSVQVTAESDGGIYPCDFYVLDEYRLGTIGDKPLKEILFCDKAREFIEASLFIPEECKSCEVYALCRNGCRRDRLLTSDGLTGKNYYCEAYKSFFLQRSEMLARVAEYIGRQQR